MQAGIERDARAALDFLKKRTDLSAASRPRSILIFGRSLGGAAAISLAASAAARDDPAIAGVMVENTFTSITDFVGPLLGMFLRGKIADTWNSYERVGSITQPILFLSGEWRGVHMNEPLSGSADVCDACLCGACVVQAVRMSWCLL